MERLVGQLSVRSRWRVVMAAAMRLAALYAVGVAVLLSAFGDGLTDAGVTGAFLFVFAFMILALARRFALSVSWGLMLVFWIRLLSTRPGPWGAPSPFAIPGLFVLWTSLALPLFAIVAFAAPEPLPTHRRRRTLATAGIVAAWLTLAMAGRHFAYLNIDVGFPNAPYHAVGAAAWGLWAPAPFVLAALSWVGWRRRAGDIARAP